MQCTEYETLRYAIQISATARSQNLETHDAPAGIYSGLSPSEFGNNASFTAYLERIPEALRASLPIKGHVPPHIPRPAEQM